MKKMCRKTLAAVLAFVMVASVLFTYLPSLGVSAAQATEEMSHLVSGANNGNQHFGRTPAEAFVLSEQSDFTDEDFSFTIKLNSEASKSRIRLVTKYVDDSHWGYIGFDLGNNWFCEYTNGTASSWPSFTGTLPTASEGDTVTVSGSYTESAMNVTVTNETTGVTGTAVQTDANFIDLKNQAGKVGYGAATYVRDLDYTDIYFANTKVGSTELTGEDFEVYSGTAEGYTYEPSVLVTESGANAGKKWIVVTGGSNNGGGHAYGNANASAPALLLDNSKTMEPEKGITLTVKPSSNWGVFYNYVNDDNWLYVGYDSSSKWYYQYNVNGSGSYASIGGNLTTPVEGEELKLGITLSRENLSVTVNDTTATVTNQNFISYADTVAAANNNNLGRFGVKTNGATSISFTDFEYNRQNCMDDEWVFCVERAGQSMGEEYSAIKKIEGTVTDTTGAPIEGATVRIGTNSTTTNAEGKYAFDAIEVGDYAFAVTKFGYQAYSEDIEVTESGNTVFDVVLSEKQAVDLSKYDQLSTNDMIVYIGKTFPVVARYEMKSDATGETFFRGNETDLNTVVINGVEIAPTVTVKETTTTSRTYALEVVNDASGINLNMDVKISVEANTLTWEVTELTKNEGCVKIATIDIPELNLLSVDAAGEPDAAFAGATRSTDVTVKSDFYITFDDGFVPSATDGYMYAFLSNGKLSAGLHSNSEAKDDKRVERVNTADTMSLTSAAWYYECGDDSGQSSSNIYDYRVSELPQAKVAIAGDLNDDEQIDWNDGAIAFRDVMHIAQGSEDIKELVNYRVVMNFASMAPNPFLATADSIKKVYLATDGLPQAVMLKGYGNEGHDSANSEYADIAERQGGVEDFQELIKIAHEYNTEVGIHVNAQEAYPESKSFNDAMVSNAAGQNNGGGWGWLDQSYLINKLWDLSTDARLKRFVQLYDRINGTNFYSGDWEEGEYVEDSQGFFTDNEDLETAISSEEVLELIKADAAERNDNMDFIYLDVWHENTWQSRRIAEEINSLGWRFSTEFGYVSEYDITWYHWASDAAYGGSTLKGHNSDIIRFLRNEQRDTHTINHPVNGGASNNPLLGGFELFGYEGWQGQQDFNAYIRDTFTENLPTRFLQHYEIVKWVNYEEGQSPVSNEEKEITLKNDAGDVVVVTRNEEQRSDEVVERTITLNGKKVLDDAAYLLPWTDNDNGEEKLYHFNLDGGTTTWELVGDWANLENVVVYKLTDQGRVDKTTVAVNNGSITLTAEEAVPYVVVKGAAVKELKEDFGEGENVVDPGFNGYVGEGEKLDSAEWSGDITADSVVVEKSPMGNQQLVMNSSNEDVAVTTTISGLTAGKDYVAEIYVDNRSEAKATITVDAGNAVVSNYTEESIVGNYVQCDNKSTRGYDSKMQRIQVSFVAESDTATFTLSREAGEGATYWDDIRIVEQKVDNFQEDGSFVQDFESVVQGLYPFVLGSAQGVSDPVTHLSQTHAPYTETGWNGRVIDDTIDGEWSLKHHGRNTGIIYQTIPQNFRFEPGKVYTVEFDYQTGSTAYQMVVGNGTTYTAPTEYLPETMNGLGTQHVEMQVVGAGNGQTWIGLYENGRFAKVDSEGNILPTGETDFILDNLVITLDEDAKVVTVSGTELYLGEVAEIYGSSLDEITWTTSKDGVVTVDKANNKINAIGAGTVTVTATFATGETEEFTFTVKDSIASDIDRTEYANISSTANTEEAGGEGAVSGYASAATDGDSSTYWHSQWSGSGFVVSPENPAILTVDLGTSMEIGGFKFQQRNQANRVVTQYGYNIKDAAGNIVASGSNITTDAGALAWVYQLLDETVEARYIEFIVEEGSEGFACLAEIAPISVEKIATKVSLEDATVKAGETVTLEPELLDGSFIKGLVWTSADETVATVNANGVVTGVKAGTATITLSNATGTLATAKVTVTGEAVKPEPVDKTAAQKYYDDCVDFYQEEDYTKETWKAFEDAMNALKDALADEDITEKALQAAVDAVADAADALVPASTDKPEDTDKPQPPVVDDEDKDNVATGDHTPVMVWMMLMAAACAVLVARKRRVR